MVVSAQVYVKHPDLALADTIRSVPDVDISVIADAGTDPRHDAYFFWIETTDFETVEAALSEDHTVEEFATIIDRDERRAYRIEYSEETKLISPPMTRVGAVTVESRSHRNGWLVEVRLQNHDGLQELREYAREEGITLSFLELQQTDQPHEDSRFGLTEPQHEALVAAFVHGYYEEPRETFLEDLADLLDISQTAVSGRLRRGSARLIEEVLVDEADWRDDSGTGR